MDLASLASMLDQNPEDLQSLESCDTLEDKKSLQPSSLHPDAESEFKLV